MIQGQNVRKRDKEIILGTTFVRVQGIRVYQSGVACKSESEEGESGCVTGLSWCPTFRSSAHLKSFLHLFLVFLSVTPNNHSVLIPMHFLI